MGDTVPQSAQSGGGELVQRVPPHLVPLPSHIEDDGAAHQLVGHDQERGRRVEGTLRGRGQVIILYLNKYYLNINIWTDWMSCFSIYQQTYHTLLHYNYPAI